MGGIIEFIDGIPTAKKLIYPITITNENGDKTVNLTIPYTDITSVLFDDDTTHEVMQFGWKRGSNDNQIIVGLGDTSITGILRYYALPTQQENIYTVAITGESGDKTIDLSFAYTQIAAVLLTLSSTNEVIQLPWKRGSNDNQVIIGLGDETISGTLRYFRAY